MKKLNNRSAFTLIEIIVVMIIVGVLAAIALPNIFSNVARGQAASALESMSSDKTPLETCVMTYPSVLPGAGNCSLATLNLPTDVSNGWTVSVQYASGSPTNNTLTYQIQAVAPNALATTGSVTLTRNTNGNFNCSYEGNAYAQACGETVASST